MAVRPELFFLEGRQGRVFASYFPAAQSLRGGLLYLPPFAEEMNRCRATVAEQARRFSALGFASLLLDPYGTGDSEGDFSETSWTGWIDDARLAAAWMEERLGQPIALWGARSGALLAADLAHQDAGRFRRLLLWQPVIDGKLFLTQTLRLRVANLMDRGLPPETTESMRSEMQAGGKVEVAGYCVPGALASGIDACRLADLSGLCDLDIVWLEHASAADKPLAPPSQKAVARLVEQGCRVKAQVFTGEPVWQLHERASVPELLELTCEYFQGASDGDN